MPDHEATALQQRNRLCGPSQVQPTSQDRDIGAICRLVVELTTQLRDRPVSGEWLIF
jgi:hypothetical protein